MTDARWQRQWSIFHDALEKPPEARAAFVAEACKGDSELLAMVEGLLAAHADTNPILDEPVLTAAGLTSDLSPERLVGRTVDDYRILSVVGEGGMGIVYEAEQQQLGRRVALKLIRLGMDTQQVVERFNAERHALALMNHVNIAQVMDAGATDAGRPYFVMEYVDGAPITNYCDRHRLTTGERIELFLAVCAGVQHAHQKGVIHRDLKPTNVLVAEEDGKAVPKIIDFGIAKATAQRTTERTLFTQAGVLIGTPEYMSPEQATLSDRAVDTRTDVYSLGVLLYELLIGALPFEPDELRRAAYDEICRRIREEEPSRPSVKLSTLSGDTRELASRRRTDSNALARRLRGDLDWITMRALEKQPERRYASPSELAADLRRHINDEPVEAGPPSMSYRVGKFARRHTLAVATGAIVFVSLLAGVAAATWGLVRAQRAEAVAMEEARTAEEVSDFLTGLFRVSEPSAVDVDSITAREVLDRGVERIRDELGDEPVVQSRLMLAMGNVYSQLGLLEEAEALLNDALRIRESLPKASLRSMTEVQTSIAGVKHLAGKHEEAVALYEQAIASERAGTDEPDAIWLATAYRSLGGVLDTLGRSEEAIRAYDEARALLKAAGEDIGAEYARVVRNIGMAYWSLQDFDKARPFYEESLATYDKVLEDGHPEVSYVVNALAILNYNLGDYEAARPMFERELANLERTLGREHRNTASIMSNLGLLLLTMELPDEARPLITESLAIREKVLGPDHDEVAVSLLNLGRLQMLEEDYAGAAASLRRCLEIRRAALGPNHPHTIGTIRLYAAAERELGNIEFADDLEAQVESSGAMQ